MTALEGFYNGLILSISYLVFSGQLLTVHILSDQWLKVVSFFLVISLNTQNLNNERYRSNE